MAPLEPHEKVLLSEAFLDTEHGEIACESCHGGNSAAGDKSAAHDGLDPQPSINNPEGACGDCHDEIVETASASLHATLSTFKTVLKSRAEMSTWAAIDEAREGHCAGCHTSCGGCHVSRPEFAGKGFVDGHLFRRNPDPLNQCTACHGSRVGHEYYGSRGLGDAHASRHDMDCASCHGAAEMHASAAAGLPGRYYLEEMPSCGECHQGLAEGPVREHAIHIGGVQCQVCHSQTYVNCYGCHTGRDAEGLRYFRNEKEVEGMKIGLNYDPEAPGAGYEFMLVRHEPTDPDLFSFYIEGALGNFGNTPTWKRTSPHNIQRRTWQSASCNHCHGNRALFLDEEDLLEYEREANRAVIVPDSRVPETVEDAPPLRVDTGSVRDGMVVSAEWLHENLHHDGLVIVDPRGREEYRRGHIEGAVRFDPLRFGIRTAADAPRPNVLVPPERIADLLGKAGIAPDDHVVVYGTTGEVAGFLIWVLEYAGAQRVSYLDGGIDGWEEKGFELTRSIARREPKKFAASPRQRYLASTEYVRENLDDPGVIVVDARTIAQAKGLARHDLAQRAGAIPGSVNLPLGALYMENGSLRAPGELLWVLGENGITPGKTVITTCNTGIQAGAAFFILRHLGFEDVRVHDESWIAWGL